MREINLKRSAIESNLIGILKEKQHSSSVGVSGLSFHCDFLLMSSYTDTVCNCTNHVNGNEDFSDGISEVTSGDFFEVDPQTDAE